MKFIALSTSMSKNPLFFNSLDLVIFI